MGCGDSRDADVVEVLAVSADSPSAPPPTSASAAAAAIGRDPALHVDIPAADYGVLDTACRRDVARLDDDGWAVDSAGSVCEPPSDATLAYATETILSDARRRYGINGDPRQFTPTSERPEDIAASVATVTAWFDHDGPAVLPNASLVSSATDDAFERGGGTHGDALQGQTTATSAGSSAVHFKSSAASLPFTLSLSSESTPAVPHPPFASGFDDKVDTPAVVEIKKAARSASVPASLHPPAPQRPAFGLCPFERLCPAPLTTRMLTRHTKIIAHATQRGPVTAP